MYLDGQTVTLSNVPTWRAQLGLATLASDQALLARVAALETALEQTGATLTTLVAALAALDAEQTALEARVTALEGAPPGGGGGTNTSGLVLGDDSNLYRLKIRDVDGNPMLDQEAATFEIADNAQILGDDGLVYRLRLRVVDGALLLDQEAI